MSLGEKAMLRISSDFGYGARGAGGVIPPNADLNFEVELLGINGKSEFCFWIICRYAVCFVCVLCMFMYIVLCECYIFMYIYIFPISTLYNLLMLDSPNYTPESSSSCSIL